MFGGLAALAHGLRVFVQALLYGLQHMLMLPARDPPLLASRAARLKRTVAARIGPIPPQLLPVLLVRVVVLQLFAGRAIANRMTTTESPFLKTINDFCNKIGTKRTC